RPSARGSAGRGPRSRARTRRRTARRCCRRRSRYRAAPPRRVRLVERDELTVLHGHHEDRLLDVVLRREAERSERRREVLGRFEGLLERGLVGGVSRALHRVRQNDYCRVCLRGELVWVGAVLAFDRFYLVVGWLVSGCFVCVVDCY